MDLKELKAEYSFKAWLPRVRSFAANYGSANINNRKQAAEFEQIELDNWWDDHYKDFSRYNTWHYLYAGLNCFNNYSKQCAFYTHQYLGDKKIESIVDVGAGIGLSTMLLADLFPDTKVYYNNITPSLQAKFFELHSGLCLNQPTDITEKEMMQHGPFDILFASEYFEHFEYPMRQLDFLLNKVGFKFLVINNSFNVKAYGHFKEFKHNETLAPKKMSKLWLKTVRESYNELDVKCWNGRPKIFEKK